jgi:hypothetical protein
MELHKTIDATARECVALDWTTTNPPLRTFQSKTQPKTIERSIQDWPAETAPHLAFATMASTIPPLTQLDNQ